MPSIGIPQYSRAAGPANPTAAIRAAVDPAIVYAGALPATAMTIESNRPRTLARKPGWAGTGGDVGSMLVVMKCSPLGASRSRIVRPALQRGNDFGGWSQWPGITEPTVTTSRTV